MEPKTQRKYVITSLALLLSVVLGELQVRSLTYQFDFATKELKIWKMSFLLFQAEEDLQPQR